VTPDELLEISLLEPESALGREWFDRQEVDRASAELSTRLAGLKAIKPDPTWARYLLLDELHSGFWSGVYVEGFTASQLVVTLNAIHQGNLYNADLVNRAFRDRLFARISRPRPGPAVGEKVRARRGRTRGQAVPWFRV
jgi:hypothetical protein